MKTALRGHPPAAKARRLHRCRALTIVELLSVLAAIAVILWLLLPALAARHMRNRPRLDCQNNLRYIGLAFRQFATDNNDKFPQSLSTNQGGIKELVNSGPGGAGAPARVFWIFVAMSNHLATPKSVICSYDKGRTRISNYFGMIRYAAAQGGGNASVSYFVNLDARDENPQAILSGDRNLSTVTNAKSASDYDAFFSVERRIRPEDVKPGGAYANLDFQKSVHYGTGNARKGQTWGNVLLADGSVRQMTGAKVREQILVSTNELRLIFPFVPGKNE